MTQAEFLKELIGRDVTVYLATGVRLSGKLLGVDDDVLFIFGKGRRSMVYKSSISTVYIDEDGNVAM
jgi:RNA chaperone Hfq